jgi:glutamyl-tRNA reductase
MLTIGASHRTATSAMLGDFSRAAEAFRAQLREGGGARGGLSVQELAVLSTCARVEVYAVAEDSAADEAARLLGREVFGSEPVSGAEALPYRYRGPDAVRHVCRVAAGLESFVVGEHEIAGQVSRAFKNVVRVRDDANVLEGVAAVARRASRRVRSETDIGRYPASVSSVAVDLVRERLGDLSTSRALVVGAGKAGLLVARALRSSGVASLAVVNRSLDRAREVASEVGGEAAGLVRLPELLAGADVVVTATGAEGLVIDVRMADAAVRARSSMRTPLLIVDLALPGDVAPEVGGLGGLELLTLEDVKGRVHRHLSLRRDELGAAERVVDEVVDDFLRQQDAPDVDALIGEVRRSIEAVRSAEVGRWLEARGSDAPPSREELDQLTRSIVNKLLHDPMRRLRSAPPLSGRSRILLRAARELVGLDLDEVPGTASRGG